MSKLLVSTAHSIITKILKFYNKNIFSKVLVNNYTVSYHSARSGLLLDSDHTDALEKIRYLESKHQRTAEEEMAVSEAPQFGHQLKDVTLDEAQPAHFETTLTPVNDATMKVVLIFK